MSADQLTESRKDLLLQLGETVWTAAPMTFLNIEQLGR